MDEVNSFIVILVLACGVLSLFLLLLLVVYRMWIFFCLFVCLFVFLTFLLGEALAGIFLDEKVRGSQGKTMAFSLWAWCLLPSAISFFLAPALCPAACPQASGMMEGEWSNLAPLMGHGSNT